jgi:hypothetical protein
LKVVNCYRAPALPGSICKIATSARAIATLRLYVK